MKGKKDKPKLHLIKNPKSPDVLLGVSDVMDYEPEFTLPRALTTSYFSHPSNSESPAVS